MKTISTAAAVLAATFLSTAALAGPNIQTGSANGLSWTAKSNIVGQTSTGTGTTTPTYFAYNTDAMPGTGGTKNYSGTVGIIMTYSSGAQFVCSGSLLSDRRSVATAAHCVSDGYAATSNGVSAGLVNTKVVFLSDAASLADISYYAVGPNGVQPNAGTVGINVGRIIVNQGYTGEVIDQNDIAILRLAGTAPEFAQSYGIYTLGDLTTSQFNVASFGTRSLVGGAEGTTGLGAGAGPNRRREGDNIYDYAWGDEAFGGFFTDRVYPGNENFFGSAEVEFSFVSDFDNGLSANDTACQIAEAVGGGSGFCDTGLGEREVGIAGGDSGGGGFINGQLASINSYGITFGTDFGDFKCTEEDCLQSSWGEFNGYVPTYIHTDFINNALAIPEPSQWALMLGGFGLLGGAMRRRKARVQVTFA